MHKDIKAVIDAGEDGEAVLCLLFAPSVDGRLVHIFLKVSLNRVEALSDYIQKNDGSQFDIRDYGEVLAWGYDEPDDAQIAEMREKYGFDEKQLLKLT